MVLRNKGPKVLLEMRREGMVQTVFDLGRIVHGVGETPPSGGDEISKAALITINHIGMPIS